MNKHHRTLELDRVLEMLAEQATCAASKELALRLEPCDNYWDAADALQRTADINTLTARYGTPGLGGIHLLGAGLARSAGLRIPEGQTHSAAAAAGGRGRGAPSALCSADGLRRHGGLELLGEPALGVAGLRPRLGRTEPV